MKNNKALHYLVNLSFFLYFVILIAERLISVIRTFANGFNPYGDAFDGYVYTVVFLSIAAFIVYLVLKCKDNIKALAKPDEDLKYTDICIASGILLLSGMVHTAYTLSIMQFVSYGILIVGILLRAILNLSNSKDKPLLWLSFAYLVSFSMAIPVMYPSFIEAHVFFHILEAAASILLVGIFTFLMIMIFEGMDDLFLVWPIIIAIAFDVPLIAMRWAEEPNVFVMIFIILSTVLFGVGWGYKLLSKKK